jgi:Zn-dependent peptidase ImmA (M78 family)
MGYHPARESGLSKSVISRLAESIAKTLNFHEHGDLSEIISRVGGRVDIEDTLLTDPDHTGSLFVDEPRNFRIVVPSHTSVERDRFTVAHEFGHYVLHYLWQKKNDENFPDKVVAYRRGSNLIEWEANWFAASFLMPEAKFAEAFKELNADLSQIASKFGVSFQTAQIRAKELGYTV